MKNKFILLILSAICCLSLAGCSGNETDQKTNLQSQKEDSHSTENESAVPSPSPTAIGEPKTEQVSTQVCFIGNSLIDYGNQADFLIDLSDCFGRKIFVDQITWGGAYLSDYAAGTFLDENKIKTRLEKADIVVFQDYGGWQGAETLKSIQKLITWCKEDASFYYYMYDEDDAEMQASDYKKLAKLKMKLIPKGQMIDALSDMSYTYEELHLENDFHPNLLNGYMAALVMHSTIFDKKCSELPKEWVFGEKEGRLAAAYDQALDGIHGNSEQEKWEELQIILKKADQLIQNCKEQNN